MVKIVEAAPIKINFLSNAQFASYIKDVLDEGGEVEEDESRDETFMEVLQLCGDSLKPRTQAGVFIELLELSSRYVKVQEPDKKKIASFLKDLLQIIDSNFRCRRSLVWRKNMTIQRFKDMCLKIVKENYEKK